ncbi:MAG: class I SAM-dependent methyltransferase [Deltaproteobacteria bacterium]|nr:class I SAM-dependent methyltransferase [Deltaproteobacteria bacterium]
MDLKSGGLAGYELIDSGDGRKLERFGDVLLDRPSAQAIWPRSHPARWEDARAVFLRGEGGGGEWQTRGGELPESWSAELDSLVFEIRLTGFGNVGLFPEHSSHFAWMRELIAARDEPKVLNLFAYTGGATIACALSGANVVHVDSAKAVNGWAKLNAENSGVPDDAVRYLADDATKLAKREIRRDNKYEGIVIDPPSFGRGPKGEVWKLERGLAPLIANCQELLVDSPLFLLLTAHSPGVTPAVLRAMLAPLGGDVESGEMLLEGGGPALPAGAFARWTP